MTQIISVITKDYVILASDRLLTHGTGPQAGQVIHDDECKLVSLCHMSGIAYSGLAHLGGMPTHKWIAKTLAVAGCRDAGHASEVLIAKAPAAIPNVAATLRRQTFVISGWARFDNVDGLQPHICVVSNYLGQELEPLAYPQLTFRRRIRLLQDRELAFGFPIGVSIRSDRATTFARNLRRITENGVGPRDALRLIISEIFATHCQDGTVGDKVLALCIPRSNAESMKTAGHGSLSGLPANTMSATYSYFDREYNEFRQPGPTIVCGEFAATDLMYTNEPSKPLQAVSWRILHAPSNKT
jgi:hypothetical protein